MSQPTHTRIRMFNTKDTYPNQTLDNDLCQAVRSAARSMCVVRWERISKAIWWVSAMHARKPSRR